MPPRRRVRAPAVPAIPAGSWLAAGGRFFKLPRPPVTPIGAYTGKATGIPLTGGQAQAAIPSSGALTLSVGPQGLGTVWYPAQVTIATSVGPLDTSTALVYYGIGGVPVTLIGTVYTGNGTVAVALPPMTPGELIIVKWSGATSGSNASVNILGSMDALTTGG